MRPAPAEASCLLNTALDQGVNFIDTSRAYGESEAIIGRSIFRRRVEFILAPKVQTFVDQGLSSEARRARMIASAEESLSVLQTDCLDLSLLATTNLESNEFEACVDVLDEIRHCHYTRFAGISAYSQQPVLQSIRSGRTDTVEVA